MFFLITISYWNQANCKHKVPGLYMCTCLFLYSIFHNDYNVFWLFWQGVGQLLTSTEKMTTFFSWGQRKVKSTSVPKPTAASSWTRSTPTTWLSTKCAGTRSTREFTSRVVLTGPWRSGRSAAKPPQTRVKPHQWRLRPSEYMCTYNGETWIVSLVVMLYSNYL